MSRRPWALILPGLPVLVLALALAALMVMPDWLDRWVARQLSASITGELAFDLSTRSLVGTPAIEAADLRWRPPAGQPGRIDVQRAVIRTTWAADADDRRELDIALVGGDIELYQGADGQWIVPEPVQEAGGAESSSGSPLVLQALTLSDLRLRLVPYTGAPIELGVSEARILARDPGWAIELQGTGRRGGLSAEGRLGTVLTVEGAALALAETRFDGRLSQGAMHIALPDVSVGSLRLAGEQFALESMRARLSMAEVAGLGPLDAQLALRSLTGTPSAWSGRLDRVALSLAGTRPAHAALGATGLSGDAGALHIEPVALELGASLPAGTIDVHTDGGALDLVLDTLSLGVDALRFSARLPDPARTDARVEVVGSLTGTVDPLEPQARLVIEARAESSRLEGALNYAAHATPPMRLEAVVDRLDLDRWTPTASAPGSGLPLDVWRDWPVQLDLRVGRLTWQGVVVEGAQVRLGEPTEPSD